jgi:hypothetical protein
MDSGHWQWVPSYSKQWVAGGGQWSEDIGQGTVNIRVWVVDSGQWMNIVDSEQ